MPSESIFLLDEMEESSRTYSSQQFQCYLNGDTSEKKGGAGVIFVVIIITLLSQPHQGCSDRSRPRDTLSSASVPDSFLTGFSTPPFCLQSALEKESILDGFCLVLLCIQLAASQCYCGPGTGLDSSHLTTSAHQPREAGMILGWGTDSGPSPSGPSLGLPQETAQKAGPLLCYLFVFQMSTWEQPASFPPASFTVCRLIISKDNVFLIVHFKIILYILE